MTFIYRPQDGVRLPLPGKPAAKRDLRKRTSSGDWVEDRVTWREELEYKKVMGFV